MGTRSYTVKVVIAEIVLKKTLFSFNKKNNLSLRYLNTTNVRRIYIKNISWIPGFSIN